jgi:hypothetical protein
MAVVKTYNHAELAFHIEPYELVEIVGNTLGLAQLALVGIANVSTVDRFQFDELARGPFNAQHAYHEFVKANFPKGA